MPWSVGDVDSHKKGLSDKQKKQWVRIANSVLSKCMKDGGKEEDCAATAIKQANGVVGVNSAYSVYKYKQDAEYQTEFKVHQGVPHLVVPVVMMVEGVLNGSAGPLLHLSEEFGKYPGSWDGIPVVIDHPADEDGAPISANSPDIIDTRTVGRIYHTNADDKKLRSEVWFDEERLNTVAPKILEDIHANKLLEVSVGVFTDDDKTEGEFNGIHYNSIARNHRPDHLAVLTEEIGACSCEDGCGLGANAKTSVDAWASEKWLSLRKKGYAIGLVTINKEQGYNELMSMVYDKLRSMDTQKIYHYCEELYDDFLIYSKSGDNDRKMYKQTYKVESGKIEFVGEPIEVHKKVEYVVNSVKINSKKEVKMAEECKPCIKAKVDALIANEKGRWKEDDREFLQSLSEGQLDKMVPIEVEKVVEKTVTVNAISKEDEAALATYKAQLKEQREQLIHSIQVNSSKELWPDEVLNGMDDKTLKRVFDSVKKEEVVDYSMLGSGVGTNAGESIDGLYPVGIEVKSEK